MLCYAMIWCEVFEKLCLCICYISRTTLTCWVTIISLTLYSSFGRSGTIRRRWTWTILDMIEEATSLYKFKLFDYVFISIVIKLPQFYSVYFKFLIMMNKLILFYTMLRGLLFDNYVIVEERRFLLTLVSECHNYHQL